VRVFFKICSALLPLIAFGLSACDTVDGWTSGKRDQIMVKNNDAPPPAPIQTSTITQEPAKIDPITATPVAPPLSDSDLRNMTTKLSGGSVEIYPLDDDNVAPDNQISLAPIGSVSSVAMPAGQNVAGNPSVTVYPLDDFGGVSAAPVYPANAGTATGGQMKAAAGKDVSSVYFPYGSANLDGSDQRVLKDAAEVAKFAPVDRVSVEGHASPHTQVADPVKSKILNLKESMNRAFNVSRTLIEQGVPAEKIKTVGWGDTVPAGSEEAQRRVDVVTGGGQAGY